MSSDMNEPGHDHDPVVERDAMIRADEAPRGRAPDGPDEASPHRARVRRGRQVEGPLRRAWARVEGLLVRRDGSDIFTGSVDDRWRPPWMLAMICAALAFGAGTVLVLQGSRDDTEPVDTGLAGGADAVETGTCYTQDTLGNVTPTSCANLYTFQIVATLELETDVMPDDELLQIDARLRCIDRLAATAGVALPPEAEMRARTPSSVDWSAGERTVICEAWAADGTSLVGSML